MALFGMGYGYDLETAEPSEIISIPTDAFKDIPIVRWKLFEIYEKRWQTFMSVV